MYKLIAIIILLTGVLQSTDAYSSQIKVTLYADEGYPPYSYTENNKLKGIYVEVLTEAMKYLPEYKLELVPLPWKRGLSYLETGRVLGLVPPYFTKERHYIEFSLSFAVEHVVIFCHSKVVKMKFPEDFKGLLIGINAGFSLADSFTEATEKKIIRVEEGKNNEINIKKLALKRIDCYANDRLSVYYTLSKLLNEADVKPYLKNMQLHEVAQIDTREAYIGYSKKYQASYKYDFMKKMNDAILKMHSNGQINQILKSYIMSE